MNIIFLDIDGVLQPGTQYRFQHDLQALLQTKASEDPRYITVDKYDLGAVVFDWNKEAVSHLRMLTLETKSKILISSSWRISNSIDNLRALFDIYELGEHITDVTPQLSYPHNRIDEILNYLELHPQISNFVIIDDCDFGFKETLPNFFVQCSPYLQQESYAQAHAILSTPPTQLQTIIAQAQQIRKAYLDAEAPKEKACLENLPSKYKYIEGEIVWKSYLEHNPEGKIHGKPYYYITRPRTHDISDTHTLWAFLDDTIGYDILKTGTHRDIVELGTRLVDDKKKS